MNVDSLLENIEGFNWNKGNAKKNWLKHRVGIKESEEVFFNKPLVFFKDEKHSIKEKRFGVFGKTNKKRLLTIIFTIRGKKIRIISARNMSRKERKSYE